MVTGRLTLLTAQHAAVVVPVVDRLITDAGGINIVGGNVHVFRQRQQFLHGSIHGFLGVAGAAFNGADFQLQAQIIRPFFHFTLAADADVAVSPGGRTQQQNEQEQSVKGLAERGNNIVTSGAVMNG